MFILAFHTSFSSYHVNTAMSKEQPGGSISFPPLCVIYFLFLSKDSLSLAKKDTVTSFISLFNSGTEMAFLLILILPVILADFLANVRSV